MKRIISYIILLAFSLNAMAAEGNLALLERHIDEFTYATTVEMDQSNQSLYNAQLEILLQNMKNLQAKGLTQKEVISLLEQKMQNKKALENLRVKLALLSDASTDAELKAIFSESKDLYSQGASWNGDAGLIIGFGGIGLVLLAIAAYKFWWKSTHECVEWQEEYKCYDSRCHSTGSGENESTVCYGQVCGMFNECVRHERKGNYYEIHCFNNITCIFNDSSRFDKYSPEP